VDASVLEGEHAGELLRDVRTAGLAFGHQSSPRGVAVAARSAGESTCRVLGFISTSGFVPHPNETDTQLGRVYPAGDDDPLVGASVSAGGTGRAEVAAERGGTEIPNERTG
jgi:hypothetical protein